MIDYEREQEFHIERIWFWYQHVSYVGRGLIIWNPKNGFRIRVVLDRKGGSVQEVASSGRIRIADQRDTTSFRIRFQDGGYGIVPDVFLQDREGELNTGFLSYETEQIIFINKYPVQASWNGSALFSTLGQLKFPDSVEEEISINKHSIFSCRRGGLLQDDANGI